ncbi:MAG: RNA polymerase sigma factor [Candidatus Sumerlaeota bacterium]|nr:RNA polymerase sigma factor [Candidatus Sumerlaeota bacterium]
MVLDERPPTGSAAWTGGWPGTIGEFERLVDAFQDPLVRFAFRRLGNRADAEDVAQEIFVRAYADRRKRQTVANVSAYLYRMTANLCVDFLRKRERRKSFSLDEAHVLDIPSRDPDSARLAAAAEEVRRIERLLSCIPPTQAEAVRLCLFDDLTTREAAEILNCPEATVKSRVRYGLEKLRELARENKEDIR